MGSLSRRLEFEGLIAGAAFSAGGTVVVGLWRSSPFGSFIDVMWVRGDGERVLLAPSPQVRAFLTSVYEFDRSELVGVRGGWDGERVRVEAGPMHLWLRAGRRDWRSWLFALRPRPLLRLPAWIAFEDRLARPLVGRLLGGAPWVRAAGRAPGGQREWYGIHDYRPVVEGRLLLEGRDAGHLVELPPGLAVGLSSFPTAPAIVHVLTIIEETGRGGAVRGDPPPCGPLGRRKGETRVAVNRTSPETLLRIYLNDHLAAMSAEVELARRCRSSNRGGQLEDHLSRLVGEVEEERRRVRELLQRRGMRESRPKQVLASLAEKIGRLKLNGQLLGYSDLSRLVELEGLCLAAEHRLSLWRGLEAASTKHPRVRELPFPELAERASRQRQRLEEHRLDAARRALVV